MSYPVGSEWRKWDLHIHTPASYHWNGSDRYNEITDEEAKAAIKAMNNTDVAVFAIQDYWTFDGYWTIRNIIRNNPTLFNKTLFPGIELRVEASRNLDVHVIFSNDEDIIQKDTLDYFLSQLRIPDITGGVTDRTLMQAARQNLTADMAKVHGGKGEPKNWTDDMAYLLGAKSVTISAESLDDALSRMPDNSYLIMLPFNLHNGLKHIDLKQYPHHITKMMRSTHLFEEGNEHYINCFLNIITSENEKFLEYFQETLGGYPKPCVRGSDAHKYDEYGLFHNNPQQTTWIKADPTFQGLLQVLNEPVDRVFVGEQPEQLKRVHQNRTKYIRSLTINRTKAATTSDDAWFDDFSQEFNKGLVVIIGNRGMGKSALLDIIALAGRSQQDEGDFSFLNKKKFRDPAQKLAEKFEASLAWQDDNSADVNLNDFSRVGVEKVKYLPQQYLERICNENAIREGGDFDKELKKVLFSHVAKEDRLGKNSLEEVLEYRNDSIRNAIKQKIEELVEANQEIVRLQKKQISSYKVSLEQQLKEKQNELDALVEPEEVEKPKEDSETVNQIQNLREEKLQPAQQRLAEERKTLERNKKHETQAKGLSDELGILEIRIEKFKREYSPVAQELGFNINDLLKVEIDVQPVRQKEQDITNNIVNVTNRTIEDITNEIEDIENSINSLQAEVEDEQQEYQKYLKDVASWELQKKQIQGDKDSPGTFTWLQTQLAEIDSLDEKLETLNGRRKEIVHQIYLKIKDLFIAYESLMSPAQKFINEQRASSLREAGNTISTLSFSVRMELERTFIDNFLDFINQGRSGPFYGIQEGRNKLEELIEQHHFDNFEDFWEFTQKILDEMQNANFDLKIYEAIENQLLGSKSTEEFYKFLFSVDYLQPNYVFQLDGRDLTQLSPGERGMLLLIFYLLIDKSDSPLLIDQPDENLDNQTIETLLKPCVKIAKRRRQIFVVTHNPNVTIGCDADQVIYAQKIDNRMDYIPGSIEDRVINKAIVDIQEGTWPAFKKRGNTYIRID